jgi:glycosyltransferase involved in cell wall biosynthesis
MRSGGSVNGCEVPTDLRLSLVTLGDPTKQTGGHRYQRVMAAAASEHGAEIRFSSIPARPWPAAVAAASTVRHAAVRSEGILLDSIAASLAAPWVRPGRVPFIAVVHQQPGGVDHGPVRSRFVAGLDRGAYRRSTGAIAVSEGLADDLRRAGVPSERIRVVPPGCDVPVAAGAPLDLRRGRRAAILCVANWSPGKGIMDLVEAFASLPEEAATLWLVGSQDADRTYADRVRRRISASDLRRRVIACGTMPIEQVGRFHRAADVFALCSTVDTYGIAWAEAISAGLPVIGWHAANLPRLAEDGREALMPEPGDHRGLASALRTITTDVAVRRRLAAAARRRAQALPTWDRSAERFFLAVRQLLLAERTTRRVPSTP